jgi:hypothetical protein
MYFRTMATVPAHISRTMKQLTYNANMITQQELADCPPYTMAKQSSIHNCAVEVQSCLCSAFVTYLMRQLNSTKEEDENENEVERVYKEVVWLNYKAA